MESIQLPATLANLEKLIDFAVGCAKKLGFEGQSLSDIRLASEEALVNVINYAYPSKEGNIEVSCEDMSGKGLKLEIKDSGIAFDPLSLPTPDLTLPMEQRKIGGMGIFMIRKVMSSVTYRRENGKNILTLTKLK